MYARCQTKLAWPYVVVHSPPCYLNLHGMLFECVCRTTRRAKSTWSSLRSFGAPSRSATPYRPGLPRHQWTSDALVAHKCTCAGKPTAAVFRKRSPACAAGVEIRRLRVSVQPHVFSKEEEQAAAGSDAERRARGADAEASDSDGASEGAREEARPGRRSRGGRGKQAAPAAPPLSAKAAKKKAAKMQKRMMAAGTRVRRDRLKRTHAAACARQRRGSPHHTRCMRSLSRFGLGVAGGQHGRGGRPCRGPRARCRSEALGV